MNRRQRKIKTDTVQPFLSIVIPAYNEERRLPGSLEKVLAFLQTRDYPAEVIVVDDGSTDNTVGIVKSFMARYPSVSVIKNDHRGKGYAVRTGMLAARGAYVLFSDADLATPIDEVDRLLAFLEDGCDIVIGSRGGLGAQRINEPGYRHLMGRVFNVLVRLVAVGGSTDIGALSIEAVEDRYPHYVDVSGSRAVFAADSLSGYSWQIGYSTRNDLDIESVSYLCSCILVKIWMTDSTIVIG